jgi:hypothetical protein
MPDTFDFETLNPGTELRNYLSQLIPKERFSVDEPSGDLNYISRIDWYFKHEEEYHELIYQSSINFLLRRLVKSALYFKKKNKSFGEYQYIDETRNHLVTNTRFDENEIEKILWLLLVIVDYHDKVPSASVRNKMFEEAKAANIPCYMCGRAIDFDDENSWEFVQLEHIWPKGIGGSNMPFNLKVACRKCNHYKEELIDSPDFHFEQMSYQSLLEAGTQHQEFKYAHKLAIWGKNNYRCTVCNKPAAEAGPLNFKRKNEQDTWHFLNINAYCDMHYNI